MPSWAAEVTLLRDSEHSHPALAPVRQHIDAVLEMTGEAVELVMF
jgi:hypothetical protein